MSFGQRLKDRRADLRLTGEELGRRMDPPVSKQTIAHWERDRYKPNVDQVAQLCIILRIPADALVLANAGTLSARAAEIAGLYDALPSDEQKRWDLMLSAMLQSATAKSSSDVKTNRSGNHLSISSNSALKPEMDGKGPILGPTLSKVLDAKRDPGEGSASDKPHGLRKPGSSQHS